MKVSIGRAGMFVKSIFRVGVEGSLNFSNDLKVDLSAAQGVFPKDKMKTIFDLVSGSVSINPKQEKIKIELKGDVFSNEGRLEAYLGTADSY